MSETESGRQSELEYVERLFARGFVILGGVFWVAATFAGPLTFGGVGIVASVKTAIWPFLATVATLIVGWKYERIAAVLLFGASAAVPIWGLLYNWEAGVWLLMACLLIAPMALAGILFLLAERAEIRRTTRVEPRL
jgi:hypothetical protein